MPCMVHSTKLMLDQARHAHKQWLVCCFQTNMCTSCMKGAAPLTLKDKLLSQGSTGTTRKSCRRCAQDLVSKIIQEEPLLSENRRPVLLQLICRLQQKMVENEKQGTFKVLKFIHKAHILPLTNCAFNKAGDRFITGSYDRTCKVWDTATGDELLTLEGHRNVVYAVAFNNPFGDKVLTGSFDKTAKLWDTMSGELSHRPRFKRMCYSMWGCRSAKPCCSDCKPSIGA
jgi:WD40 repeat protein